MASELDIYKINPHAFAPNGILKPFSQQYGEYSVVKEAYDDARKHGIATAPPGKAPMVEYTPFVLSQSCVAFGIEEIAQRPLIISKAAFDHIRYDHQHDVERLLDHLDNLTYELANNLIAFQSKRTSNHIAFVLDTATRSEHPVNVVVGVDINVNSVDVASVRTMFGNAHLLSDMNEALSLGRRFFTNKRTGAWIEDVTASGQMDPSGDLGRHLIDLYCTRFPEARDADRLTSMARGLGRANPSLGDLRTDAVHRRSSPDRDERDEGAR